VISERLKQARKGAGLSTRALGELAGVSAMAISKYETGKSVPSSPVLLNLSKALNVKVEYFFRPMQVTLEQVEYRKHSHVLKRVLGQIEADVKEQVERFLELESYLPNGPIKSFEIPSGLPEGIGSYADIEKVANTLRAKWSLGLNPVPDLTDTLEERGIKIFQTDALHDNSFDGLAAHVNGTPVIVLGKGWPGDRQRFTLAHELGHLVLKGRLTAKLDEEMAANRFAGAFLVPDSEVRKELGERRTWLEPNELSVLKKTYGLSMQGWMHRANDLGILSDGHYQSLVRLFSERGWRKTEPGEQYRREEPKLFEQLVFRALAEDLISESKAAELMKQPLSEFRKLRNLEHAAPHQ
jgi:Zn-dependent peptidase ImmA (M78 family)/DNA-binding XRE family transcriptional regulator